MLTVLRGECFISWAPALLTNTPGLPLKAFQICVFWVEIRYDLSHSLLISMPTLVKFMDKDLLIDATGECEGPHRLSLLYAVPDVLIQSHGFMSCARSTKTQWSEFQKDKLHRSIHDLKHSL